MTMPGHLSCIGQWRAGGDCAGGDFAIAVGRPRIALQIIMPTFLFARNQWNRGRFWRIARNWSLPTSDPAVVAVLLT